MKDKNTRAVRKERTRRALIRAGRKLVARHGVSNLSLRGLAKLASYSPAALYEYFASKQQLVAALAADVAEALGRALAAVPTDQPPSQRLVDLGVAYVEFALGAPADFGLLFMESSSGRRSLDEAPGKPGAYSILADAVGAVMADAGDNADSGRVEMVAYGLWSLAHGMATLQLTHLDGFDADFPSADRAALTAIVRGYFPHLDAIGGSN